MDVITLINNSINHNSYKTFFSRRKDDKTIIVSYRLSIPFWIDDRNLIKDESNFILYSSSKKKNIKSYKIGFSNLKNLEYPKTGKNKFFIKEREYKISDILDKELIRYFSEERQNIFRELKSNIVLEKIGLLTKEYNALTDGKNVYSKEFYDLPISLKYYSPDLNDRLNREEEWH